MQTAMEEAKQAALRDEVPIGAVMVDARTRTITARAGNRTIAEADPTSHAEMIVIRETSGKAGVQRLPEYDLYVTLEPCTMCAAAISFARLRRVIFAAKDPKGGGILHGAKFYEQPTCHHRPDILYGLLENESSALLKNFFREKRTKT
ncbi:MAG: nucleoside deaminase [Alphaproteobacteria bacterium]|nr:nucleoside deaminase [Alphaproteobacteria bacterium]